MSEQKTGRVYHPWAVGITAVIVLFLIATITVAVVVSRQDFDLVTQNYYEKDLGYQKEIDARKRTAALAEKPALALDPAAETLAIAFPSRDDYMRIQGGIILYRISDAARDLHHPLALDTAGRQLISVRGMQSGQWIAKLRWTEEGKEYYVEERVYLKE